MHQNLRQDVVYGVLGFPFQDDGKVVPLFSPKPFRPYGLANPLLIVPSQFVSDVKADIPVELVLELYYAHPSEGRLVVVLPERRKGVEDYEGLPPDVVEVGGFSFGLKGV